MNNSKQMFFSLFTVKIYFDRYFSILSAWIAHYVGLISLEVTDWDSSRVLFGLGTQSEHLFFRFTFLLRESQNWFSLFPSSSCLLPFFKYNQSSLQDRENKVRVFMPLTPQLQGSSLSQCVFYWSQP